MTTEAILRSIRRWLAFACVLLALLVVGVGLTVESLESTSSGDLLARVGFVLALAALAAMFVSRVRTDSGANEGSSRDDIDD